MIDDPVPRAAPLNMAIDEALLQTTFTAVLRFYRWQSPAVSFGYFGRFDEASQFAPGHSLVRRWTGGGIVPHGDDLTYSLIIAATQPACQFSSPELYLRVHQAIAGVLRSLGVATHLASKSAPRISDSCFANPVAADLLDKGRKIAGAAHRRTRHGLLHQGSIQRGDLDQKFREKLAAALTDKLEQDEASAATMEAAEKLALEKYATDAWLRRR